MLQINQVNMEVTFLKFEPGLELHKELLSQKVD